MARFDGGWVKLWRRCLDDDIGRDGQLLAIWVWLLGRANWTDGKYHHAGISRPIPPGTVVTATREIARQLGFSKDKIGRSLKLLESTQRIRVERASRGIIVTIENWDRYQSDPEVAATMSRQTCATDAPEVRHAADRIEEERRKNKETRRSRGAYDPAFDEVYKKYPKKEGKAGGFKIYRKLSAEDKTQVIIAIENYAHRKAGSEIRFIKHFDSFMGEWRDWLDPETGTASIGGLASINTTPLALEEIK